jgi:hypothetical protein
MLAVAMKSLVGAVPRHADGHLERARVAIAAHIVERVLRFQVKHNHRFIFGHFDSVIFLSAVILLLLAFQGFAAHRRLLDQASLPGRCIRYH